MNETLAELKRLDGVVATLEQQAQQHEQLARDCRAKRAEAKQQAAELRAVLHDSQIVAHSQGTMAAAESAKGLAEMAAAETQATLARLKEKESALDQLLADAREAAAAVAVAVDTDHKD